MHREKSAQQQQGQHKGNTVGQRPGQAAQQGEADATGRHRPAQQQIGPQHIAQPDPKIDKNRGGLAIKPLTQQRGVAL